MDKPKLGRPPGIPNPLGGAKVRSPHGKAKSVSLTLPVGLLDRLEETARREGRSKSSVMTRILDMYFHEVKIL